MVYSLLSVDSEKAKPRSLGSLRREGGTAWEKTEQTVDSENLYQVLRTWLCSTRYFLFFFFDICAHRNGMLFAYTCNKITVIAYADRQVWSICNHFTITIWETRDVLFVHCHLSLLKPSFFHSETRVYPLHTLQHNSHFHYITPFFQISRSRFCQHNHKKPSQPKGKKYYSFAKEKEREAFQ